MATARPQGIVGQASWEEAKLALKECTPGARPMSFYPSVTLNSDWLTLVSASSSNVQLYPPPPPPTVKVVSSSSSGERPSPPGSSYSFDLINTSLEGNCIFFP